MPGNSNSPAGNFLAQSSRFVLYSGTLSTQTTLQPATVGNAGGGQPHANLQPYLVLNFCIALAGIFPIAEFERGGHESSLFVGEIRMAGFNFAPVGWALCNGQLLPISQNPTLFALIGTIYGGDGQSTFQLPDLQGRIPINQGQAQGTSNYVIGQLAGSESVALVAAQLPQPRPFRSRRTAMLPLRPTPPVVIWPGPASLRSLRVVCQSMPRRQPRQQ